MFFYIAKQAEKHHHYNYKFNVDYHAQRHENV